MAPKKRPRQTPSRAQARAAASTPLAPARRPAPRRPAVRRNWGPLLPVAGSAASIALLIGIFFAVRWYEAGLPPGPTPSAQGGLADQVYTSLASLPASDYAIGAGTAHDGLQPISESLAAGGKPLFLYIGAEYCPYCAAQRWPMVIALARFGTFTGLGLTASSATDVYPNTPTFTFRNATYSSQWIAFQAVETSDNSGRPLQSPSADQQAALTKHDPGSSIPFIDIAGKYYATSVFYSPQDLSGMSATQVANALQDSTSSTQSKDILGAANLLTAAICAADGGQPAAVCSDPAIKAIKP